MSREFAKAVRACYEADDIDLRDFLSLVEQRSYTQNLATESASDVPKGTTDKDEHWVLEGMVAAKDVATSSFSCRLRKMQRVCEDSGKTVPTTTVELIVVSRAGTEMRSRNAALSGQNTNLQLEFVTARAVGDSKRGQLAGEESRVTANRTPLTGVQMALEWLGGGTFRTEAVI